MSVYNRILIILILFLFIIGSVYSQNNTLNLYVSPSGNDNWSGKLPNSNKNKTDGPFLSLERARNFIRDYKKSKLQLDGPINIYLRVGTYNFSKTFTLTSEDAGTAAYPINWLAYNNEKVIIIGGKTISGFEKIEDMEILKRISKTYQNKILSLNLKKIGIENYGEITPRSSSGLELFFKNKRMTIARYPDDGWLKVYDVPQTGEKLFNKGLEREKRYDGIPVGRHYGKIKYYGNRPERWKEYDQIFLHGYWTWDWSDAYQKVKTIDTKNKEIVFQEPHHNYGYTKNQRYYFANILEELDKPEEWFLDRKNGILYFWPPEKIDKNNLQISLLEEPLISLDSTEFINIKGITFQCSRGMGIVINKGKNNLIGGCTFTNLGNVAVKIDGGFNNGVKSSNIYDLALGSIILNGGDRKTLDPAGNFAENNHIHDYSKWVRTGQLGIFITGVGNRISKNLIHNAPHEGIYIMGNDHVIEYNEIFNVCNETGDAGAIHTGRNYTWRGNTIRYNYFHDLKGPGLHGVVAIYLDDFASGFNVYGNICYRAGRGTLIGGGRDNLIANNIYIDCKPSIVLDARGLSWASYYFDGTYNTLFETLKEMKYDKPPYSTKYPELINIVTDSPAVPKNNRIINNISFGGRWIELLDYFAYNFSTITLKNNLIAGNEICKRVKEPPKGWEPYYLNLDTQDDYRVYTFSDEEIKKEFKDDTFINTDPGFIDLKNRNFRLKTESKALKLNFKQVPIDKIGLYIDEYRKSTK